MQIAGDLDWPLEGFREAFREVLEQGMAKVDWRAKLLWLPRAIDHNKPESPNVVRNWGLPFRELPECALKVEAYQALKTFVEAMGEGFGEAFREAFREDIRQSGAGAGAVTGARAGTLPEQQAAVEVTEESAPAPAAACCREGEIKLLLEAGAGARLDKAQRLEIEEWLMDGIPAESLARVIRGKVSAKATRAESVSNFRYFIAALRELVTAFREGRVPEEGEDLDGYRGYLAYSISRLPLHPEVIARARSQLRTATSFVQVEAVRTELMRMASKAEEE